MVTLRVAVLSSVKLYGEGLVEWLRTRDGIAIIGSLRNVDEINPLLDQVAADLLLLDTSSVSTLGEVRQLVQRFPGLCIVAVALRETEEEVIAWAEAGVSAYVSRNASLADLYATIFSAMRGEQTCSPHIAGSLLRVLRRPVRPESVGGQLTSRESETFRLMVRGYSNKQIADSLHISVSTVKNHVHTILEKLSVRTRAEAVARMAGERGQVVAG